MKNQSSFRALTCLAAAAVAVLSGCTTTDFVKPNIASKRDEAVQNAFKDRPSVVERDEDFMEFERVSRRSSGNVSINASGAPFGPLVSEMAKEAGVAVSFSSEVDATRRITVDFRRMDAESAIRQAAFMAGYTAVFNRERTHATIAQEATYTYRLPASVFSAIRANYSVGGNAAASGSGGSGGGGSSLQGNFTITGSDGPQGNALKQFLTELAESGAKVTIADNGLVAVRGTARALRRIDEFVKSYAVQATSQVEIEASIIEVTLNDDFQFGLDFKRLGQLISVGGSPTGLDLSMASASSVSGTGGLTAAFTAANTQVLVKALRLAGDTRVISQPRILAVNGTPATFFDGQQLPYLGNLQVTSTGSGSSGATQTSGQTSFAVDGISFSVVPTILDDKRVELTLMPVISNVQGFETFDLGTSGKLKAPRQGSKQSMMKVMAESGRTLVLGGLRYSVEDRSEHGGLIPIIGGGALTRTKQTKEVVILLRAAVLPSGDVNPLIGESL